MTVTHPMRNLIEIVEGDSDMRRFMSILESVERVADQTQSPQFRAWFGGSKVVDDSGKPLVVYHGTPQMLDRDFRFDPSRKGISTFIGIPVEVQRHGFFFAVNRAFAESFAKQPRARGKGTVLAVYLRIQNPLHMTSDGVAPQDVEKLAAQGVDRKWLENWAGDPHTTYEQFDEDDGAFFSAAIKAAGFDGVVIDEHDPDTKKVERVWIAFSPGQIKSVNNRGTFNSEDDRIAEAIQPEDATMTAETMRHLMMICESWEEDEGSDERNDDEDRLPSKAVTIKDGRTVIIRAFRDYEENCISIYASVSGDETIAEGKFDPERSYFRGIEVATPYRRLGVATAIYDYMEEQGFHVQPSNNVQPDGQRFWSSRSRK